jgi:riboflavin synthase
MFTGIVQRVGTVSRLDRKAESLLLAIALEPKESNGPFETPVVLGESIAINGVCLTVTEFTPTELSFFVGFETLNRSNLRNFELGSRVNLERALLASDRLSGHIVQGHVDGEAKFLSAEKRGDQNQPHWKAHFEIATSLSRYCVDKGSITLNGVSLTIAEITTNQVTIMLIPHTWEQTNFSKLTSGDSVNVEVDVLAKYLDNYLAHSLDGYLKKYMEKYMEKYLQEHTEKLCPPTQSLHP